MTITLRDITKDNWQIASKLTVRDDQKGFVAPNWFSMLQVVYSGIEFYDKGIYNDEEMVGYAMMKGKSDDDPAFIFRLMVAQEHQAKGYGRSAMKLIIDDLKTRCNPNAIFISFEPHNAVARKLYESLGFVDTGELRHGEVLFRLPLT